MAAASSATFSGPKLGMVGLSLLLWRRGLLSVADFVMSVSISLLVIAEARNLSRRFLDFFEYVGNIEIRNLGFGYAQGSPVFEHLDLQIPAGQHVGLVGYSGSGKSTLVNLLLRLYDPQSGQVLIDGVDIAGVSQASLHAQIGLIPQDPGLFHRSLLENIGYGRDDADLAAVEGAARLAHAHDFIATMPHGYDSLVGERGVKLSGGQRQRIAIARVILKNAPILILDEATASLDSVTEEAIQDSLEGVMQGKTVIVVAHRLSTIAHLDRILVFDQGRIVEDGSHAELLGRGGLYHRLWSRQSDGFLLSSEPAAAAGFHAPREQAAA